MQAAAATWEQHAKGNKEHSAATIVPVCEAVQSKASAARDLLEREVAAFLRSPDNRLYMMPAGPQVRIGYPRFDKSDCCEGSHAQLYIPFDVDMQK